MDNVIKVNHLRKEYNGIAVVKDLNISVKKGEIFGLLGANGAGKSTTIECIIGTCSPTKGYIQILNMNPITQRKELFEKVGVQFQEANYQSNITVEEICEETASLYKETNDWKELLHKFNIENKVKSKVKDLSGGQRQRLFIVLSLIPKPEVLFLDELTTGVDVKTRRKIWSILKELRNEGITIFISSHFMDEVEALCDNILILRKGETIYYGTVNKAVEMSPYDKFEDAYLWYAGEEGENDEYI